MDVALVSVVIPAYNAAATLPAALESLVAQTFADWEAWVVDDGSTDATAQVAKAFSDSRVLFLRQANAGPSAARNRGLAAARGEWVAFLDADDTFEPDKLTRQLAAAAIHPEAVAITCDWHRPGVAVPPAPAELPWRRWREADLWSLNRFQTSTVLARRQVLTRLGGFDPAVDGAEDWELWIRLAGQGPVVHLLWPLVAYADSPGGVSKDLERVYRCGEVMLRRHLANLPPPRRAELLAWHHLRFAVAFRLAGDPRYRRCLRPLRSPAAWPGALRAFFFRLVPFLWGRVRRRLSAG
ncbi:MAG: glycosyltransferase family A protein [Thermaerobacter sp.]|nr:glycosyltransferase family A protein [Thermaerobacter sp.]